MNQSTENPDVFGKAISDFFHGNDSENIVVHSEDFEDDTIPVAYLFRSFQEMPAIEKTALKQCHGKVLDVGCGAGSHALYLQENRKLPVTAIDSSKGAVEICLSRGISNTRNIDFFDLGTEKFDTVLLLMNGSGIIGKLKNLTYFFEKLKSVLAPNGKALIDSSDLRYLFDTDDDGGIWIDASQEYYGEMTYRISYKNTISQPFDWLYIDFETLKFAAESNGFQCRLVEEGTHYDYLAELKVL